MRFFPQIMIAGLALALCASSAAAHDERWQAAAALNEGMSPHAALGYRRDPANPDLDRTLPAEAAFIWTVMLRAGVHYRIYGTCDDRCSDLDMEAYGADGMLADRDIGRDKTPYVQITPRTTGRHAVRIWAYECHAHACEIAARVVSGGRVVPRAVHHDDSDQDNDSDSDNASRNVVTSELDDAGRRQTREGYTQFGEDVITSVERNSDGYRETLNLIAGTPYVFVGACDSNCHDVDMEILDARGAQVAADVASDDRPVVGVTPPRSGAYTIRIWLSDCRQEQCDVGIRSFTRERPRPHN